MSAAENLPSPDPASGAGETLTSATPATREQLNEPTKLLFWCAAYSHTLRAQFGIKLTRGSSQVAGEPAIVSTAWGRSLGERKRMDFTDIPRPWLRNCGGVLGFDPLEYAKTLQQCSEGEFHMRTFILNVWNPNEARERGWTFDLFKAVRCLDAGNLECIATVILLPSWP